MKRVLQKVAIAALPAALVAVAFAAQDRYSLQVPRGLAFAELKGNEDRREHAN